MANVSMCVTYAATKLGTKMSLRIMCESTPVSVHLPARIVHSGVHKSPTGEDIFGGYTSASPIISTILVHYPVSERSSGLRTHRERACKSMSLAAQCASIRQACRGPNSFTCQCILMTPSDDPSSLGSVVRVQPDKCINITKMTI
ncbi:hypothetical protein BIW11_10730 [Tropilaelaps mercedesae]|uniref:Uncharacterized protein n=1 Tax=Tropilaelaps mercedesae TaxID=418985 RepID=A0A1V9XE90_9ACAR|nr:hypothetical protein BIW11_10730 [Tropilaelaps mercedesae]